MALMFGLAMLWLAAVALGFGAAFRQEPAKYENPAYSSPGWFAFRGRIGRKAYALRTLCISALPVAFVFGVSLWHAAAPEGAPGVIRSLDALIWGKGTPWVQDVGRWVLFGALVWANLSATVLRLHDFEKQGMPALLILIPCFQVIIGIVCLFIAGNPWYNTYGAAPFLDVKVGRGKRKTN